MFDELFLPLIYVLKYAVKISDAVLEVQLLSLFKLFFQKLEQYVSDSNKTASDSKHRDNIKQFATLLIPILIRGLESDFPYVRE